MMHWWYGMGVWRYALMTLGMVLFWGVIVVLVIAVIRSLSRNNDADPTASQHVTPEEILAERIARGEISEQEYEEGMAILRRRPHSQTESKAGG